jgi:NAD(P)-dependent dehydrogenase (short-subunit alcohol dehydrogenase family)
MQEMFAMQSQTNPGGRTMTDPREKYPKPPYDQEPQPPPGDTDRMNPAADHGETSYRGSGKLTGRVAMITGGDSGIGRAVALAYAREGADVAVSYESEHDDARDTEKLVTAEGRKCLLLPGDIGREAHCKEIVERTVSELGRLDILVNNAAFQRSHQSIAEITAEELDKTFRVNLYAMFFLAKAALDHIGPGGSIINTTSIQSYQPSASLLAYAATKGAITNFTKGLSEEAIEKGIRVNAVAPGPVWTPLIPSTLPPERVKEFGKDTPVGRAAQPAELAPVYVLLASDEASFITGAIYEVTGGKPTA